MILDNLEIEELNFKFKNKFDEFLGFNPDGFSTVKDSTGWFHIDSFGKKIYKKRYERAFGFYCELAAVKENFYFHINTKGEKVYKNNFLWVGNFVENRCSVKLENQNYKHINLDGSFFYDEEYFYVGDYSEGFAVVTFSDLTCNHINYNGKILHKNNFLDLGVFHKGYAVAKDEFGFFHIDINGMEIYKTRFDFLEPFYNGIAFAVFKNKKCFINENGDFV